MAMKVEPFSWLLEISYPGALNRAGFAGGWFIEAVNATKTLSQSFVMAFCGGLPRPFKTR
jgi:hypothetical protein